MKRQAPLWFRRQLAAIDRDLRAEFAPIFEPRPEHPDQVRVIDHKWRIVQLMRKSFPVGEIDGESFSYIKVVPDLVFWVTDTWKWDGEYRPLSEIVLERLRWSNLENWYHGYDGFLQALDERNEKVIKQRDHELGHWGETAGRESYKEVLGIPEFHMSHSHMIGEKNTAGGEESDVNTSD